MMNDFHTEALVDNVADESQVKKARLKESVRDRGANSDLKKVLSTPEGKRVWREFLEDAMVFRSAYAPDTNLIYYNSGRQDLGRHWMTKIQNADPEAFREIIVPKTETSSKAPVKPHVLKEND